MQQHIESTAQVVGKARRAGAYRCAPRELAQAQAQLEFARAEVQQGDYDRANAHLERSELNAKAAQRLSQGSRCRVPGTGGTGLLSAEPADADRDGDGVPDRVDLCPDVPEDVDGYVDRDGCVDDDNDSDGVPDSADGCPGDPEDVDGFSDADGCPDPDNDEDGVLDGDDACPDTPGAREARGCAASQYPGIELTDSEIRLDSPIVFEPGTGLIRSVSFPILDTIARLLQDQPAIRLEVQGHTDSQGAPEENLTKSQHQAEAVRNALVQRGVDSARLTARGYGETRPIESNRTSQGRALNRRIEFRRIDGDR